MTSYDIKNIIDRLEFATEHLVLLQEYLRNPELTRGKEREFGLLADDIDHIMPYLLTGVESKDEPSSETGVGTD